MRNADAAERILSPVTTPDRAASSVGDLLEEASGRGACWFWSSTLRTAAAYLWRDLRECPGRMLWLAISGLIEFSIGATLLGITVIKLWMTVSPYQIDANREYIPPYAFFAPHDFPEVP